MSDSFSSTRFSRSGSGSDYLRPEEASALIVAASRIGRNGLRDKILLRLIYRHDLRAGEVKDVLWTDFNLENSRTCTFRLRRPRGFAGSLRSLDRDERKPLLRLLDASNSPFVFVSEEGIQIGRDMIGRIVSRAAYVAKLGFHVHPGMLRLSP